MLIKHAKIAILLTEMNLENELMNFSMGNYGLAHLEL